MESEKRDCALRDAIVENICELCRFYGSAAGHELHDSGGILAFVTGVPYAAYNGVASARIVGDVERRIMKMKELFRRAHVPFSWWTHHLCEPEDLGERLAACGVPFVERVHGMAAGLAEADLDAGAAGLEVRTVADAEDLSLWMHATLEGFDMPREFENAFLCCETRLGIGAPFERFIGLVEGFPVTTSSLFLGAKSAGIYFVATLPKFRRSGFGAAMTRAAMRRAKDAGYDAVVLQSSDAGELLYRKLGFRELCTLGYFATS